MKLSNILSAFAAAALLMAACTNEQPIASPVVSTAQGAYEIPAEGGTIDIVFRCNMPWKITVLPGNAKSNVSDIHVSPSSGEGSEKDITVVVKANKNEGDKRVAVISILGSVFEAAVQVTQPSANAPAGPEAGTLANPYKASELAIAVKDGNIPSGEVYVRSVISKVQELSAQYGNATYWLTDDGEESADAFEIFRGKSFGGASFTAEDEANPPFAKGDVVTVVGEATSYNGTPEFKAGNRLVAVNGLGGLEGEGTAESPYSVAKAMAVAIAAGNDGTPDDVYIKGIISEIKEISTSYGNATFWISDDGFQPAENTKILQIFRAFSFNGDKFTDAEALAVGDEVVLVGRLKNYNDNTPETNSGAKLVSLNGKTE